jgi:uncharacterized protein YkwD
MKTSYFKFLVIITVITFFTSCTQEDAAQDSISNQQIVANYNHTIDENQLVDLVNNYRQSIGLNSLELVNHISHKSQEHNSYMIANNVVNHDLFDERSSNIIQVLGAKKVGENIAYNFTTSQGALSAWLLSPSHKLNLDGDYTHIGISITINPVNGKKYYTNMFMKR